MNADEGRGRCAALDSREIVVRYVSVADRHESALARLLPRLTAAEQTRAGRFRSAQDRLAFALGRGLVRTTLSQYDIAPPDGWQFVWNTHGKPELVPSSDRAPLRFSIAHCAGMVAVGVALGREIGVDVESVDGSRSATAIAHSCFTPDEVRIIESLPLAEQPSAFVAVWTLKEAYVKACGLGLSIPLADFSIALDPPRLSFSPRLVDDDQLWWLWQTNPTPWHYLAVAARRQPDEQLTVNVREIDLDLLM
jgi:4'-phosphopantetheinyl transferase